MPHTPEHTEQLSGHEKESLVAVEDRLRLVESTVRSLSDLRSKFPKWNAPGQVREGHIHDLANHLSFSPPSGATITVQEDDATVDAAATVLDFTEPDAVLVSSSPAGEANVNMGLYALLLGRGTPQVLSGGLATNNNLTLRGTSNATPGTATVIISNSDFQMGTNGKRMLDSAGGERLRFQTATPHLVITGDLHMDTGFVLLDEMVTPATPGANSAKLYAKDVAGVSHLMGLDDAGVEHDLFATGSGGTLDQAYDFGGAHLGRIIEVDNLFPVKMRTGDNGTAEIGGVLLKIESAGVTNSAYIHFQSGNSTGSGLLFGDLATPHEANIRYDPTIPAFISDVVGSEEQIAWSDKEFFIESGLNLGFPRGGSFGNTTKTLTADESDWAPANSAHHSVIRVDVNTADILIHGLSTAGFSFPQWRIIILHNVGSFNFTLKDQSATCATATHRFDLSGDKVFAPGDACILHYDDTTDRWRIIGSSVVGAAGGGGHEIRENGVAQTTLAGLDFIDADAGVGLLTDGATANQVNLNLYVLLAQGRAGGSTIYGGNAANENLILGGTENATHTTSIISLLDHVRIASGKSIQDSGGTARITLETTAAGPNVLFNGGLRITPDSATVTPLDIITAAGAVDYIKISGSTTATVAAVTGITISPNTTWTSGAGTFTGVFGQPQAVYAGTSTGGTIRGLDYAPLAVVGAAITVTLTDFVGVYSHPIAQAIGASRVLNVPDWDNFRSLPGLSASVSGTLAVTALSHFKAAAISTLGTGESITTLRGLWIESQNLTNITNYYPLYIDGPASTTEGSVHRPSLQLGSVTRAYGGGDGVLGIANATTVPTTDPTGGLVLFSEDQSPKIRNLMAVKQPLERLLYAPTAPSSAITATSETAFSTAFNFPANSVKVGNVFRVTAWGVFTSTAGDTLILRLRWGGLTGTVLLVNTAATLGAVTDRGWKFEALLTVITTGATGTIEAQGQASFYISATPGIDNCHFAEMRNTAVVGSIDTTAAKDLTMTAVWSAAGDSITIREMTVEQVG